MDYVINKNAKNAWIRDNDNTMDLSPETDASTVYLNNGRTLEQELGEGSMASNVATVNSAMSKVIDGTYDSAYESLVFKGRSLVNLCPNKVIDYVATSDWDGFCALVRPFNPKGDTWISLQDIKPNTKYLVSCYVETFEDKNGRNYLLNNPHDMSVFDESVWIDRVGLHKWVLTSKSEITDAVYVVLRCQNAYARGTIKIKNIMIIEYQDGMENWDIPYFEGMKSVRMPVLKTTSSNILPQSDFKKMNSLGDWKILRHFDEVVQPLNHYKFDFSQDSGLTITKLEGAYAYPVLASPLVEVKTGEKLYVSSKNPNTGHAIYLKCYDGNMNKIIPLEGLNYGDGIYKSFNSLCKNFANNNLFELMIADSRIKYIQWASILTGGSTYTFNEIMISKSPITTATPYEPYKSNTLTTPEEIILRSLPNGVQDTYNPLTGEYVKRVGEIVLDGSEAWIANTGADKRFDDVWVFHNQESLCDGTIRLCDKLQARESGNENAEFVRGGGTYVFIYISKNKVQSHNAINFKQWLQSNPITIQYELATPIIKKVDPKGYPFAYENGHVILESGHQGQSLLPIMDYSTVINRTGQIKSIGEQSLRQDKQINKLEQMLVGNIIAMNYNNTLLKLNLTMNEVK